MSISIDAMSSLVDQTTSNAANRANSVTNSLNSISSDSTEEQLKEVVNDFASYFVEELLKDVKESMLSDDEDSDSGMSTQKDYYMDTVIETVADELVDEVGGTYTQQLYEQMKRNYGL